MGFTFAGSRAPFGRRVTSGRRLRHVAAEAAFRGCVQLFKATGVRFVDVLLPHIGHLVCELDCYVKEGLLGMRPRQIGVVLAPPEVFISNPCALDYWRRYVWVVRSIRWNRLLARFAGRKELCHSAYPYVYALDT